jgi:hypothetical protein
VKTLALVDFFDARNDAVDGLVPVNKPAMALGQHERSVLLQAKAFEQIDYVFFRRFTDADGNHIRSSQIAAYVVDNSLEKLTQQDIAQLHHKLWLHGSAPLIYVAWPTSVDILSCAREPEFWHNGQARYTSAAQIETEAAIRASGKPTKAIQTAAGVAQALQNRFSAHRLAAC